MRQNFTNQILKIINVNTLQKSRGLHSNKCYSEMLKVCFMFKKMQKKKKAFFHFDFMQIYFFRNDCPGQRQHRDQEIHKGKSKLTLKEK